MASVSNRVAENEIYPRYIFLEPLLARKRVLEVDAVAPTGGKGGRFLLERGAASVLSIDEDAAAVERANADEELSLEGLDFQAGDLRGLDKATFDLIIVH